MENLDKLVIELCKYDNETTWIEFKHNNYNPEMIGEDISALANSATIAEKSKAYMVWGIDDKTHNIVGTSHSLQSIKVGNEELEHWLRKMLSRNANFEFHNVEIDGKNIGVLIIYKAENQTVTFQKTDYIRVGSYTKKLNEFPQVQAQLWDRLRKLRFEDEIAKKDLKLNDALQLLDYGTYFDIKKEPQPSDVDGVAHYMLQEEFIIKQDNGLYGITNLGAVLLAKRLSDFSRVSRKAVRVVQYKGLNKMEMLKEDVGNKGYVCGFEGLIKYISALIPTQESITSALREHKTAYPILAIREAVANAIIHQDFSIQGTGPVVEIFDNRIEITNPGTPLVDVKRIIDNPPKSRNEKLASLMRRLRICEELGSGWDKMAISCELSQIPAPKIDLYEDSTKVIMFSEIPFTNISSEDKLWACYVHAVIKQIQGEQLTNKSLRDRFGVKDSSSASISRLIKEAVEKKFIKPLDVDTAPKHMRYIPYWA